MHPLTRLAAAAALAGAAAAGLAGCAAAPAPVPAAHPSSGYGALPAYLPKAAAEPDAVLTGAAHHAAVALEGVPVRVRYGGGTVLATVVGPTVPGEGLPYQTPATTCTWTVTLSDATAAIPVRAQDFTTLDEDAKRYTVAFLPGHAAPTAVLQPGHSVTFRLRAVMATGEGIMRWAPGGPWIVAGWDFVVEND